MFKNCPELKDTLWRYESTSDEWIPEFTFIGPKENISKYFDWEAYRDPYRIEGDEAGFWVTPKGSPREQYYSKDYVAETDED